MQSSNTNQSKLNQILEYVDAHQAPLEVHFFTEKEKQKIQAEKSKLEATDIYLNSVKENPVLQGNIEKSRFLGKIYAPSEALRVEQRMQALTGTGKRGDLKQSVVHPTGQYVLMSENLTRQLGLVADDYITPDNNNFPNFLQTLKQEGTDSSKIDNINSAANQYGAIILQRGLYVDLKDLLDEALERSGIQKSSQTFVHNQEPKPISAQPTAAHGVGLSELRKQVQEKTQQSPSAPIKPTADLNRQMNARELMPPHLTTPSPALPIAPAPLNRPIASSPKPIPPALPKISPPPKPAGPGPKLGLNSLQEIKVIEDLRKIEPAHIRQGLLPQQMKFLRSKIAYLAGVNHVLPIQVLNVFEQSPLFKIYLQIGGALISGSTMDKKAQYDEVVKGLAVHGQDVLSIQEFESVADLRKELERM